MLNQDNNLLSEKYIINSLIDYYVEVKDAIEEHKEVIKNLEEIILDYFKVCEINQRRIDSIQTHHIKVERILKEVDDKITEDEIITASSLNEFDIRKFYSVSEYFLKKSSSKNQEEKNIYNTYVRYINYSEEEDKIKLIKYLIDKNKLRMLERSLVNNIKTRDLDYKLKITKL